MGSNPGQEEESSPVLFGSWSSFPGPPSVPLTRGSRAATDSDTFSSAGLTHSTPPTIGVDDNTGGVGLYPRTSPVLRLPKTVAGPESRVLGVRVGERGTPGTLVVHARDDVHTRPHNNPLGPREGTTRTDPSTPP